jgi:16S rRNA (guanine527-N7)-methyltransferase
MFENYFPSLTETQQKQLLALGDLYRDWNAKINVISRQDIDSLYEHHVLHSLALHSWIQEQQHGWKEGTRIVDVGTGGGFPGIPLAIMNPSCDFLLVDRIGKKVRVAQEVSDAIGLKNVVTKHAGIEEIKEPADWVVSRAVMAMPDLLKACRRVYTVGLVCLKGGDLTDELRNCGVTEVIPVSRYFSEPFFETKSIVYVKK